MDRGVLQVAEARSGEISGKEAALGEKEAALKELQTELQQSRARSVARTHTSVPAGKVVGNVVCKL